MNNIKFYKYQGTGNDFVMIDNRDEKFPASQAYIEHLCHRRFGIGADGLILLQNDPNYDFRMVYYNADGKEGSMCGNGGRCTVRFAEDLGIFKDKTKFIAVDGEHLADANEAVIALKMGEVHSIERHDFYDFMNTGSPHYVAFVKGIESFDVYNEGKKIRYSDEWVARGGTNVNFVEVIDNETIYVRTYERGVEDETYSCGTGVTASALSTFLRFGMKSPINVITKGGNLKVSFNENFTDIRLVGPAMKVFDGIL
ncbi:Diaminopimelate epimerase [Emticicia oligotrophica DSM 17448]|uniref:Diaminopimelate epimerase n=1 Tax=Emticicia oligotrophica (strain DSM 17448 / CIP 109782 / MTCC 6937 / GPTSA100-15) TaxID=929562 RepID=A0ABM5N5J2_EMTOG|nr:diaminopimelate epimerase [Emticicia oligotrophica]AFK04756.1 Diaminopimelate epimerase [Emticicia oligotrophica DSM 17448]